MQKLGLGADLVTLIGSYTNYAVAPSDVCEDQACGGLGWVNPQIHQFA